MKNVLPILSVGDSGQAKLSIVDLRYNDPEFLAIPIMIFMRYSMSIKTLTDKLKDRVIRAFKLDPSDQTAPISWDNYVLINCLLRYNSASANSQREFLLNLLNQATKASDLLTRVETDSLMNTLFGQYRDPQYGNTYETLVEMAHEVNKSIWEKWGRNWEEAFVDDGK